MSPELFLKLSALNLSTEQMAGVLKVFQEADEGRKEGARARWRKWKDNQTNVSQHEQTLVNADKRLTGATKKENKEDKKEDKKESKERATRLPEDWTLPGEWRDEAVAAGLPLPRVLSEARKMLNWSLSSRNGAKLDWRAVWRNWFQGVLESQAKATAPPPKKVTLASMWRDEGRKQGLLPSHEPPSTSDRRLEAGLPGGTAQGSNFARRIAGAGSG